MRYQATGICIMLATSRSEEVHLVYYYTNWFHHLKRTEESRSTLSLIHTGIVYRIQVLEVSKLEAIFCNHMRKAGEVLEASEL
jgi:hypothetical protein